MLYIEWKLWSMAFRRYPWIGRSCEIFELANEFQVACFCSKSERPTLEIEVSSSPLFPPFLFFSFLCRSLAGNMEQNGAGVEILQKKLPQVLWEFYVRYAGVSKFISGYVSLISWINVWSMDPTWVKCARITPSGCWEPTEKAAWLSLYMAMSDLAGVYTHGRTFVPDYYLGLILH